MFIRYHSKNGDTAARIKKHVAELDKDWFLRKKKEFEKLCNDGEDYYEIETPSDAQVVNFDLFCFSSGYSKSVTGQDVAGKIITTTEEIIDDAGDDKDYPAFKFWIDNVKEWTEEAVKDKTDFYKEAVKNKDKTDIYKIEEYTHVMYGVVHKIKWEIDQHFNNKLKALELKHLREKATAAAKKVKTIHSYKWQGKPEELPKLYNKMKGILISNESRLIDFKHIFSNKDLAMINPVKWHDDNASELLYFIMQLSELGLIAGERLNYETLTGCFVMSDGKRFTASFKNLKQSISHKLTPAKIATIEAIVKSFA